MAVYTLLSGTQAVTSSLLPLNNGTYQGCSEIILQNSPSSASTILVGGAGGAFYELLPGAELRLQADTGPDELTVNLAAIFVKITSGSATINWLARQ